MEAEAAALEAKELDKDFEAKRAEQMSEEAAKTAKKAAKR